MGRKSRSLVTAVLPFLLASASSVSSSVTYTDHGVAVPFSSTSSGEGTVIVEVVSQYSFRLGVRFKGWGNEAISSLTIDENKVPAPSTPVSWGNMVGVSTSFGSLLVANDNSGSWALYDAENNTLVTSFGAPSMNNATGTYDAGIVLPVNGTAAANGPERSCLGNGLFGPNFYYNREGRYVSLGVSSWFFDPLNPHCYPSSFSGTVGSASATAAASLSGAKGTPPPTPRVESNTVHVNVSQDYCACNRYNGTDASGSTRSSKYPNGLTVKTINDCCAACNSAPDCTGWVWSDGTNPDPTGNCWPLASYSGTNHNQGRVFGGQGPPPPQQAWWAMGSAADWYLAPAAVPLEFTRAFYELTGPPAIPPYHAMGFMATYWGYDCMEEVEGNGTKFRDDQMPLDSLIMDYDWWNTGENPDADFDYDPKMFGNHSFIHPPGSTIPNKNTSGPVELFEHFTNDLNLHWSGIRKPRTYSNIEYSNASGWLLPDSWNVGAGGNNWNMSMQDWASWYIANHTHFIRDGVSFWWNDEGETQFFTYSFWNIALAQVDALVNPMKRHFTINRSFQPGMQKLSAITWTGDRQDCSHITVNTFTTAGQLYTACDMTAPNANVLVRQYWNAVFLPIMRVHAMHGTPRFPYLWGGEAQQAGFRAALNTRYAFIPFIYSLSHKARFTGMPLALPASYIFPNDPTFPVSVGDVTYMFSDVLLPADVSTANNMDPNENTTHVNIPPGIWYAFNSTSTLVGPQLDVTYTDVPLDKLVLFVRAGAILTLNKNIVQYTGALGGDLVVQVYGGADGVFSLMEDDGQTLAYESNYIANTRNTTFTYTDATKNLSWTVTGGYASGPNLYTVGWPCLFTSNATAPVYTNSITLGVAGSIVLQ